MATTKKIAKRINLSKVIRLGDKNYTVLEYLRDTEYPAKLVRIMAEQNCSALEAFQFAKNHNIDLS